jgi:Uma2 family endonuclease
MPSHTEKCDYKSEYRYGEILPMKGSTTNHNQIAGNIYAFLKFALRGQNYRVFINDIRLWIPRYNLYTYPDVMVIQGEPIYEGTDTTTVMNPSVIIHVSSKLAHNHKEADKFRFYRSILEFQEYIVIDQDSCYVEQFTKNVQGNWTLTEYESFDAVLPFSSIDFQLSFVDIYELVNIESNEDKNTEVSNLKFCLEQF